MPDLSTITPVTREEEFLDRIARAAASPNLPEVDTSDNGDVLTVVSGEWAAAAPASCLPEVTSDDNGDVLTVVSGEWAKAAPSGGADFLIVKSDGNFTQEAAPDNITVYTSGVDHTADEIINAYKGFIPVYFYIPRMNGGGYTNGAFRVMLLDNSDLEGDLNYGSQGEEYGYYYDDGDFYMYQTIKGGA